MTVILTMSMLSQFVESVKAMMTGIKIQTKCGNDIINNQIIGELPLKELKEARDIYTIWPGNTVRNDPCGYYNCHGLTFASRRTRIWEIDEVSKIIADDNYQEIARDKVLPGDIIIYFNSKNGRELAEHSGIVVDATEIFSTKKIKVLSKWGNGPEVVHDERECTYWSECSTKKYYRMQSMLYEGKEYGLL